jgi:hypothetical protein
VEGAPLEGVWEEECLKQLPEGFAKFKEALEAVADEVPNQPIGKARKLRLDAITAAEFIRPYGPELKDFLDSYCMSALGAKTDHVNAMAFCNFYLSEITTRYAWPGGTAGGSGLLVRKLNELNPAILSTSSTVTRVGNEGDLVVLEYFLGLLPELKKEGDLTIESTRWPRSIHVVPVGFFAEWVPKLTPPVGRVFYATNNLGTPSFEEGRMYRGWKAAEGVRKANLFGRASSPEPVLAR